MIPQDEKPDRVETLIHDERERLSKLPHFAQEANDHGVLLSDRIEHYCKKGQLIHPMEELCLRPAGYDLRVGRKYAIGGTIHTLETGQKITIKPYQVAVIQTLETLNVPNFLIGRWNIRVTWAYKGLLWVGGAQVDPGFQGRLSCPIYNLSNQTVELAYKDPLAMIDFVTTTSFNKDCKRFELKKFIFEQYTTDLASGVETQLETFRGESAGLASTISDLQKRADTFVTLVFTVVAVLFAGLGIIAAKGSNEPAILNSPVWVAAIALFFSLRATVVSRIDKSKLGKWFGWLTPAALALTVTGIMVAASVFFEAHRAQVAATEVQNARNQAARAAADLDRSRADFEKRLEDLRQQYNARLDGFQRELILLQQAQAKRK